MKMSKHVINDRMDRLLYIAQYVGWGETLLEVYSEENHHRYCLTTTGVIIVKAPADEFMVTAFVGNIEKVAKLYHLAGFDHVPTRIYQKVMKNKVHLTKQNKYKGA